MNVWKIVWGDGEIEFQDIDTEGLVITKTRNQVIKQYQDRKFRIFRKGQTWRTFDLSSFDIEKMSQLQALTGPVNFYYRVNEDPADYYTCMVDRNIDEQYIAGYQSAEAPLKIKLIETVKDSNLQNTIIPGMLLFEGAA